MKFAIIGARKYAVWSARWSLRCFELLASPWFSSANSDRSGNPICSDVSQTKLDWSFILLAVMTSLICSNRIVVSLDCRSSSFLAYCESVLVTTMPSSLLPMICIRFSHSWHLLPFQTWILNEAKAPWWHCLHLTRFCGLCHHTSLSNSANLTGSSRFPSTFYQFLLQYIACRTLHVTHSMSHMVCKA